MGRKKVQEEIENLEPELEEAMEAEALEAADDSEEETEIEASEEEAEEEVEVKKPARKPRARKPRAPKKAEEPSLLAGMSKPAEEETAPEAEEVTEVVAEAEEKPKAAARGRKKAEDKEIEIAAKPWAAVNEISASISTNLERVNQMLREIPQQEVFKPVPAKPAAITKVAVGMSFFAIVLSLVSLLLSQSARQVALERIEPAAAVVHSVPTSPSEPKQLALESTLKRKPQRAPRKALR